MANINPALGQPIRNLQNFLRHIANEWEEIPMVIPDGIYGENTHQAVSAFQARKELPVTGRTDSETWKQLREEYQRIERKNRKPEKVSVYPGKDHIFETEDSSIHLIPIQAVLYVLTLVYPELGEIKINGNYDKLTREVVVKLQKIFGHEETGSIDKEFWNMLAGMYENLVTGNRFYGENS